MRFITIRRSARFYHFRKPFISIPKTDRLFKVLAYIRIRIIITYLVSRLYNKVIYLKTSVMMLEWYKFINDDENWVCQSISENNRNSFAFRLPCFPLKFSRSTALNCSKRFTNFTNYILFQSSQKKAQNRIVFDNPER